MSAQISRIYQLGAIGVTVVAGLVDPLAYRLGPDRFHPGDDFWGPALIVLFLLALPWPSCATLKSAPRSSRASRGGVS